MASEVMMVFTDLSNWKMTKEGSVDNTWNEHCSVLKQSCMIRVLLLFTSGLKPLLFYYRVVYMGHEMLVLTVTEPSIGKLHTGLGSWHTALKEDCPVSPLNSAFQTNETNLKKVNS